MFYSSLHTGILHTEGTKYSLDETISLAEIWSWDLTWKRDNVWYVLDYYLQRLCVHPWCLLWQISILKDHFPILLFFLFLNKVLQISIGLWVDRLQLSTTKEHALGVSLQDYLVHLLGPQPPELGTGLRHEIGDHPCDVISEAPVRLPSV